VTLTEWPRTLTNSSAPSTISSAFRRSERQECHPRRHRRPRRKQVRVSCRRTSGMWHNMSHAQEVTPLLLRPRGHARCRARTRWHALVHETRRQERRRIVETEAYMGPEDLAAHCRLVDAHNERKSCSAAGHAYRLFDLWLLELHERRDGAQRRAARGASAAPRTRRSITDKTGDPGCCAAR